MLRIVSFMTGLLFEVFFDEKDEYNLNSSKFKLTRVMAVCVFLLSIFTNLWLMHSYITLNRIWRACEKTNVILEEHTPSKVDTKAVQTQKEYTERTTKLKTIDDLLEEVRQESINE